MATGCGIEGPGIESWCLGAKFSPPVQTSPGAHSASHTMGIGSCRGGGIKRLGRGVDHPSPSRAQVKEKVELNLYLPCVPSWPVLGLPFTLTHSEAETNVVVVN